MESERRLEYVIPQKYIPKILACGLMLSAMLIIFSVDYLYQNQKYIELIISSVVFVAMVIALRRLNNAK